METSRRAMISPNISCRITTSGPTLDLSLNIPFKIDIVLTLHFSRPITFSRDNTPLFRRPLWSDGLTFTNIETGMKAPQRHMACILRIGGPERDLPTEEDRNGWVTLHPNQAHSLSATFRPILTGEPIPLMSSAEMIDVQEQQIKTMKWQNVDGFEDGEKYKIGLDVGVKIKEWMLGTLEDILETRKLGSNPGIREDVIAFELKETCTFEVKRPDRDGSLNYGYVKPDELEEAAPQAPREKLTDEGRAAILTNLRRRYQ